jgi:hypothetical protein
LYQFGSRNDLIKRAEQDLGTSQSGKNPSLDTINKYVDFIDKQTSGLLITTGIKSKIDDAQTNREKANILIEALEENNILPDDCFIGFNKENTTAYSYELQ